MASRSGGGRNSLRGRLGRRSKGQHSPHDPFDFIKLVTPDMYPEIPCKKLKSLFIRHFRCDHKNPANKAGPDTMHVTKNHLRLEVGAAQVKKQRVKLFALDHGQGLGAVGRRLSVTPNARQQDVKDVADRGLILDN